MAPFFETGGFANGEPAWHFGGNVLPAGEFYSVEMLRENAEFNRHVNKVPLYLASGDVCPKCFALQREDGKVLGSGIGEDYVPFQNVQMLDLVTALAGFGAKIETWLSLKEGKIVTILAQMEPFQVLGDKFFPYLSFANYHDGGSRSVYLTKIREVCWNTHGRSIGDAKAEKRVWRKRHFKNSLDVNEANIAEARELLGLSELHGENLKKLAELLYSKKLAQGDWIALAKHLFPEPEGTLEKPPTNAAKVLVEEKRSLLFRAAGAQDLENFRHTAWGALSAVTQYASHVTNGNPGKTKPEVLQARRENRVLEQIEGSQLEGRALEFLLALA